MQQVWRSCGRFAPGIEEGNDIRTHRFSSGPNHVTEGIGAANLQDRGLIKRKVCFPAITTARSAIPVGIVLGGRLKQPDFARDHVSKSPRGKDPETAVGRGKRSTRGAHRS
jgi:hypothetical protein